jgi:hypothetical protein
MTTNQAITEESQGPTSPPIQSTNEIEETCITTATQINSNTCIVEEQIECTATITITPSSRRPSTNSNIVEIQPTTSGWEPTEQSVNVAPVTQAERFLLSLTNLETHLYKFSILFDSMLILNVLLHKLTWDLGLVSKRRNVQQIGAEVHRPNTTTSEIRAHSSCSLGSTFFNRGDKSSLRSCDRRYLRVDQQGSRLSRRVQIRRSSSVEIPRTKRFSSGAKELRKERRKRLGTDTSSGSSRSKKTTSSSSSIHRNLPLYIKSLFRGRMGTGLNIFKLILINLDPCKRHMRECLSPEDSSGSEAVIEFTKTIQNFTARQTYRYIL